MWSGGDGPAYSPWSDWEGNTADGIKRPLRAAILASNPHDTQPWLFKVGGNAITLFAYRARNLGTFDPFRREMHLGLGAAVENLVLAARAFGFAGQVLAHRRQALAFAGRYTRTRCPRRSHADASHARCAVRSNSKPPHESRPLSCRSIHWCGKSAALRQSRHRRHRARCFCRGQACPRRVGRTYCGRNQPHYRRSANVGR